MYVSAMYRWLFHPIYNDRRGGATLNEICLVVEIEKIRVAFLLQINVGSVEGEKKQRDISVINAFLTF